MSIKKLKSAWIIKCGDRVINTIDENRPENEVYKYARTVSDLISFTFNKEGVRSFEYIEGPHMGTGPHSSIKVKKFRNIEIDEQTRTIKADGLPPSRVSYLMLPFNLPIGQQKSLGTSGEKYQVVRPLRQEEDGDWMMEVTLTNNGDEAEYLLTDIQDDPPA